MINQGIPWYYQEPFMPARPQDLVLWVNSSSWDGHTWRNLAPSYSNVNHGTLKNGGGDLIHPSGVFGAGLKFDGVDDYSNQGNDPSLSITDAITIEAGVKTNVINEFREIMRKEPANRLLFSIQKGNILSFGTHNGTSYSELDYSGFDSSYIDKWTHLAATHDSSGVRNIYINGVSVDDDNVDAGVTTVGTASLFIGSKCGSIEFFNGTIDGVKIYNRALSAGEIFHNYTHTPIYYLEHGIDPLQLIQQTPQEVARVVA